MPRGFKRDDPVTKMLYANGLLLDKRSFVGYDPQMVPHLLLKGDDIKLMRHRVWAKAKRKCADCKKEITYSPYSDDEGFETGWEMDHRQGGNVGRCDCLHNLQALHRECHELKTRKSEHH